MSLTGSGGAAPSQMVAHALSPRIPELDGIRGIAILLILLHHFGDSALADGAFPWLRRAFRSGWIGVDLFFVLSGYLITGILLRARGRPRGLRHFYARRALRIWPLYLAACVTLLLIVPELGLYTAREAHWLKRASLWYWFHLTNVPAAYGISLPVHTTHFWSLAIEEQFYLVWPVIVFALGPGRLPVAALVIALGGALYWVATFSGHWSPWASACWYLPALALGAWIAQQQGRPGGVNVVQRQARQLLGVVVILIVGASWLPGGAGQQDGWLNPEVRPLVGIAWAAALLLLLAHPMGRFCRWCRQGWLMRMGVISYGIYLIHNPLRSLAPQLGLPAEELLAGGLAGRLAYMSLMSLLAYGLAELSWAMLERPFLRLKDRIGLPDHLSAAVTTGVAHPKDG
jgi:peptidoglycan/LPS O-acetylase OafA/YrhL